MRGVISELVPRAARLFGDATAFALLDGTSFGFDEIEGHVARFAGWLSAAGIGHGDRVVLYLPNGISWIVAYHAIARLGAVVVPTNVLLAPSEVAVILIDAQASAIVLLEDNLAGDIDTARGVARAFAVTVAPGRQVGLPSGDPLAPLDLSPADLFTLSYTSGTTGKPKGVMLSHANVFASTAMTATVHVRVRGETVLTALPFVHVYGNVVMNAAFLVGMRLLMMERFDPAIALAAIEREKATLFEGVPTMYYQMLAHPASANADLSSLTRCTVGGQTMPTATIAEVAARFGCPVCELWGMTEVAGPALSHSPYWPPRHGAVGLPFPSMEARVAVGVDRSGMAPDGEPGELLVRGALVTQGYWRNERATAEAIDADGWLATGDVAVRDAEGYFRIVDRLKDMIISGGYKIYPAELEQVIAMHPAVSMSAVVSVSDPVKGELAKAFVVLRPGGVCDVEELETHCRHHLAAYKVPRSFAFVDHLPTTSSGKILRRLLREQVATSHS